MRIAMMTNNYKPYVGGVPISIERLTESLRERGHEVDVFAPSYDGQRQEDGVIRYRVRKRQMGSGVVVPDILDGDIHRYFMKKEYDIIHTHHPMLIGYRAYEFSRRYHIPLVLTYHTRYEKYLHHLNPFKGKGGDRKKDANAAEDGNLAAKAVTMHNRIFTNRCHTVFVPGLSMKAFLEQEGTHSPLHILPTGLSDADFSPDLDETESLRRQYAPGGENLFCSVSRLEQEKNLKFLLRAMAKYKAQTDKAFRMLLIGEGSQHAELEKYALELGLGREVIFTGNVAHEKLSSYYAACDAFLFSSQSETQGIVLLEAMAVGLPVVAVEASGVNDVLRHGCNGFVTSLEEGDFAQNLRQLDRARNYRMLCQGAHATAKKYTAEQIACRAENHYANLVEERRRRIYGYAYAR